MRRLLAAGALCVSLGGCALAGAAAGSGIAGFAVAKLTDPGTDVALVNKSLGAS